MLLKSTLLSQLYLPWLIWLSLSTTEGPVGCRHCNSFPSISVACDTVSRRGSIPAVPTVLQKSFRFFIMNIFLAKTFKKISKTVQVEIWKMVWTVRIYPVWTTQKPRKRDFGELKSKKYPRVACRQISLKVGNRLVFIVDPRLVSSYGREKLILI